MGKPDWPSDAEISAYVDAEMPPPQRALMEDLAARDPEFAARLVADLGLNETLRRAEPPKRVPSDRTLRLARGLEVRLRTRSFVPIGRRVAAAVALVALGWGLNSATLTLRETSSVADQRFVDGAREALRVAALDTGPLAPGEPIGRKIDRLEAVTDVDLPNLPANWKVLGAQVQPFNGRPSVVVTAESPVLGVVTLVAAPMDKEGAVPPTSAPDDTVPTVYWQSGGTAYALMGAAAATQLKSVADAIEVASRRRVPNGTRG